MADPKFLNSLKMLLFIAIASLFPAGLAFLAAEIGTPLVSACWFGGVFFTICTTIWALLAFRRAP